MSLPTDAKKRKEYPMYSGLISYFPDALAAISHQSYLGNQQHHPDKPLHWDRNKSTDDKDALMRHIAEGDWVAVGWRALAVLQKELEKEENDRVETNKTKEPAEDTKVLSFEDWCEDWGYYEYGTQYKRFHNGIETFWRKSEVQELYAQYLADKKS